MHDYEKEKTKYEMALSRYEHRVAEMKKQSESTNEKAKSYIAEIHKDKCDIAEKLEEAYNANIIPLQFRNIQGVYYLYDYLSTSNQSLSEALMQCNLEAIKSKLDNIIKLQGEMIVQQAQANTALFEQNQRILEAAQATMNNTAVAAQYARISAVNSTLALKMQKKELAYQRADFWLK